MLTRDAQATGSSYKLNLEAQSVGSIHQPPDMDRYKCTHSEAQSGGSKAQYGSSTWKLNLVVQSTRHQIWTDQCTHSRLNREAQAGGSIWMLILGVQSGGAIHQPPDLDRPVHSIALKIHLYIGPFICTSCLRENSTWLYYITT